MTDLDAIERYFWDRVEITTGCWLWTGTKGSDGYGQLRLRAWRRRAHRTSWLIHFGPVPVGMSVLHLCDTPLCVRPDHLFLGTQADNMHDMAAKGRGRNAYMDRVACPKSHPYNYVDGNGKRYCTRCAVDRRREARHQAREMACQ